MDVDELIAEARQVFETAEPVEQDVLLGTRQVTVRLRPLDGTAWEDLTAQHPPRPRVPRDHDLGYDLKAVLKAFPRVEIVDGDEVDDLLRVGEDGQTTNRWPAVVDALAAPDIKNLTVALWGAHEWEHQKRMVAAGKASKGQHAPKRPS
ncbi:hypothetical protein J2Y69_003065 [Microbacterium resistens]|uniref:Tail assembly chaperone n=1 Tax=Microbacterium resistens TaxID=156977 RepID=A0ABU1SFS9_9MICO|nr:hypothetical protein [Microbacterium resistens]MDR6868449.1 hypothetical protein [Microbacterium resistens]